jgi:hypothetical protein
MAEYAERKLRNAKLSVALAIAAILGGLAARNQSAQATGAEKGAEPHLAPITSADIKNASLLFKDFKSGQVYSQDQVDAKFIKFKAANNTFVKLADANNTFVKIEDANNTFAKVNDVNNTFVKIEDAKHEFVQGDGSVFTGFEALTGNGSVPVLDIPGMVRAEGVFAVGANNPQTRLTNLGTTPLHYASPAGTGVVPPTQSILIGLNQTIQLITEGSPPQIATLTVSGIPAGGQTTDFSAQALLGAGG